METYRRGEYRFNTDVHQTYAEIHDMADKPGFLGKEIKLSKSQYKTLGELKSHVIEAARLVDLYLPDYLPKYYFTFREGGQNIEPAVIYFTEEVSEDNFIPPAEDADKFLGACVEMYRATRKTGNAFMVDMKPDNLVFGHTKNNPKPHTYFVDFYPSYFDANPGIFYKKASEFAKIYGPANLPLSWRSINTIDK